MAYQDDFRNKVLAALKAKNLAVDISQEATQQAIVEEVQNVAKSEAKTMSAAEMKLVLEDVAKELSVTNKQVTAQSADFTAFKQFPEGGGPSGPGGSYSGGGIAVSVANKDIMIIPANGGLGAAGSATSVNSISQIDFKHIANPNAYAAFDPNEIKASLFNWAERITGNTFDTPVLGLGGAWGGVSYAPTSSWGVGTSTGSGVGGSINTDRGFGQIIYFKPATSTIYASLFNDIGLDTSYSNRSISLTNYQPAIPGSFPTVGFAVTFGGIGNSGDLLFHGAINEAQSNTIKFLSPLTISNATATDLITLGLSSATSTVQNFVGGGVAQYNLSTTTSSFAAGQIFYASSTGHTHLVPLNKGANNSYLRVDGSGNYEWTTTISATTASVAAASGSTVLYPIMNNSTSSGVALSYDVQFNVDPGANILRYESGSFYVGTAVSSPTFTGSGNIAIKPGADSITAVQLQTFAGTAILSVNTTSSRVGINTAGPQYTLEVAGDANLSATSQYRINGASVLSATALGTAVLSSSLTSLGTVTTGTWSASAITNFYGGTGMITYTAGDLIFAGGTANTLSRLAIGTNNFFLTSSGAAPVYTAGSALTVGTATLATTITVSNAAPSILHYPLFANATSGALGITADGDLTYNPSTNQLNVGIISAGTAITGTLGTASQPNVTGLGVITTGVWNSAAIGTTYGGTGSNLGPGGSIGNSNRIHVSGSTGQYATALIDNSVAGYILVSGGAQAAPTFTNSSSANLTLSGLVNFSTIAPQTPITPTNANDLVNKAYADSISAGLDPHASVRLATIAGIAGSYKQAGLAGTSTAADAFIISTGAGVISSEPGFDTLSGNALTTGQRVLVWYGINGGIALSSSGTFSPASAFTTFGSIGASYIANGIYTVTSVGSATSNWIVTRASDTFNNSQLTGGTFTFVEEGATYADTGFVDTNDTTSLGPIGFGNTQITWSPFSGAGSLTVGQGLSKAANQIALNFNLVQSGTVNANLSNGFSLGGTRSGSVGSSSYATFVVTSTLPSTNTLTANITGYSLTGGQTNATTLTLDGVSATNTIVGNADGWIHSGGTTSRSLNVTGGNLTLQGSGTGLTVSSTSILNFNGQSMTITASTSNITWTPSSTTATTQNIISSASAQYQLSTPTNTWAVGDMYYGSGIAFSALTRLAFGSGAGASVLIRNAAAPVWGTINLASADFVSGILAINNGGTNGNATPTQGGVAYGTGTAYAFTSAGTAAQALISNGTSAPTFGVLTLAGGGTSNAAFGAAVNYQLAAYNSAGSAISGIAQPTVSNSVLIQSAANNAPSWSNGPITLAYGGNNNATFVSKAVVYTNAAGTANTNDASFTFQSGFGLTITGSNTTINVGSGGGYFINGTQTVSSVNLAGGATGGNGAVTFTTNNSGIANTIWFTQTTNAITLNYPGSGVTGAGRAVAGQVAYFDSAASVVGNVGLAYSPTAASGVGLSVNANTASGTVFQLNTAQTLTSGLLVDIDNNGSQRYSIDFKGMATHTVGSGNTAIVITGGRTLLSVPNTNYASLNFGNTNANPGAGVTQIGDLWFNGTNLYFRKDATTSFDLLVGSVSGSGTANKLPKWSTSTVLTDSNITDAGFGMTITSTNSIATGAGSGATAVLTIQTFSATDDSKTDRYFVRGVTSTGTRLFSVDTSGNLRATTKSFDIPHPTKEGLRLVYGVLEGPEHGVYHRGTIEGKGVLQVNLPEYWHKLVGNQYTIQLTPWGNYNVSIGSKTENYFTIQLVGDVMSRKFKNIKVDYIVHGSRLDAPLDTEQ